MLDMGGPGSDAYSQIILGIDRTHICYSYVQRSLDIGDGSCVLGRESGRSICQMVQLRIGCSLF